MSWQAKPKALIMPSSFAELVLYKPKARVGTRQLGHQATKSDILLRGYRNHSTCRELYEFGVSIS